MDYHIQTTEEIIKKRTAASKRACKKLAIGSYAAVLLLGLSIAAQQGYAIESPAHLDGRNMHIAASTSLETQPEENDDDESLLSQVTDRPLSKQDILEQQRIAEELAYQEYLASTQYLRDQVVEAAKSRIGVPYAYGGTDPDGGMDCSGLTQWCYSQIGYDIPRTSYDQEGAATSLVSVDEAEPGDILCGGGHVGIYVGDGVFIHEPQEGETCCESTNIDQFYAAAKYI